MKRILTAAVTLSLLLSLAGCAWGEKPDKVVTEYCEALQSFDVEAASACVVEGADSLESDFSAEMEADPSLEQLLDYLQDNAAQMTYTLGEAELDGDQATVPVTFTYLDATPIVQAALGDYISQAFSMALGGADESELGTLFLQIFTDKASTVEPGTSTAEVIFPCEKVDGAWKIAALADEDEDALISVLTCNISRAMENLGNSDSEETDTAEADTVWYDVPAGQEVELSTIKMRVTGSSATNMLTSEYYDPDVAQEGTLFVIFDMEIENITKDPLSFNNDISLEDSQGRTYDPYPDAIWYYDETFNYTDLAPNIKVSGQFVYQVPEDADGLFLKVGKANTNEVYRLYGA